MNFKRCITALILFPLLVLALLKGSLSFLSILIISTALICFYEWKNLYELPSTLWLIGECILLINFVLIFFFKFNVFFAFYNFFLFSFLYYLFNYQKEDFKIHFFPLLTGFFYIFIGLYPFWEILNNFKREYLVYFFSIVFGSDVGAYLIGKSIGKRGFFTKISPKKTWEGFFGGLIFSILIAIALNNYFELFSIKINLFFAVLLSIVGSIGDLLESAFKRAVGKKDAGKIIVGHGGMLDRIDGVLLSSPFFLFFLKFFKI